MAKKSSWSERVAEREGVKHDARIENIFQTKQTHQAKNGRTRVKLKVKREQKKRGEEEKGRGEGRAAAAAAAAWQRVCVPLIMRCTARQGRQF